MEQVKKYNLTQDFNQPNIRKIDSNIHDDLIRALLTPF